MLQADHVGLRSFNILFRHCAFELLQTLYAPAGEVQARVELGALRLLVGPVNGTDGCAHNRENFALANRLAQLRQPARSGFDAAGLRRLHFAAGIAVQHHPACQFDRGRQGSFLDDYGSHTELALAGLGQKHAAVGQATWGVAARSGCGLFAVVVARSCLRVPGGCCAQAQGAGGNQQAGQAFAATLSPC